jgi:hypothetical protein
MSKVGALSASSLFHLLIRPTSQTLIAARHPWLTPSAQGFNTEIDYFSDAEPILSMQPVLDERLSVVLLISIITPPLTTAAM